MIEGDNPRHRRRRDDGLMTYAVGILVKDGLVMMADTRTNAGLDNVSTFRKLHVFERPGEFVAALATAGNLSISQSIVSHLREGLVDEATGERERLVDQTSMFAAAQLIGRAIRRVYETDGEALEQHASALRRVDAARRPGQGPRAAPLHALQGRQFHRGDHGQPVPADRRAQIRQANPRPRRHPTRPTSTMPSSSA